MSSDPTNIEFRVPDHSAAMVRAVFDGEYEVSYDHPNPVILDIGANVGAFALWAAHRWPGSTIHCYEPMPDNFDLLRENLAVLGSRVQLNNFAVGDPSCTKLFFGLNNCGECSFFQLGEQQSEYVEVTTRSPDVLPKADIAKLDTEGAEFEILERLEIIDFDVVLLEYHSDALRRGVDGVLIDYRLIGAQVHGTERGVLKYVHRRLLG